MRIPVAIWITDPHLSENTIEIVKNIFSQVFLLAAEFKVHYIVIGGDVFTSRKGQPEAVLNAFRDIIRSAHEKGLEIVAIPGNHDKTDYISESSFLYCFDGLPGFSLLEAGGLLGFKEIDLYFLPYYDEQLSYPKKLREVIAKINEERTNILCTHVGIDGVRSNGGTLVDNDVRPDMFDKFKHVLVGHYHDRQIVGENIIYTGSPYQATFGEDDKKGVVMIYDDPIDPLEFIDLDFKKFVTVELLPEDITAELVAQVTEKLTEAKVRIKVQGNIEDSKKALVAKMQSMGAKVEIEKESYAPVDIGSVQNVSLTGSDIMSVYGEWVKSRKIEGADYGKKILQKLI